MNQVGIVAIGRNEGERLRQCLQSALKKVLNIVYVDSGSTDGSVQIAQSMGVEVIELNLSVPFTAARARNDGFDHLLRISPWLKFVQFVDGDCELVEEWLDHAQRELISHPNVGVVCGRRRERFPKQTIFNRLCDMEWNTPIGEALACGGDFMIRTDAFQQVDGFNPKLIAGEEPELCVRLRQHGWRILRVDAEMTLHDAEMTFFGQWWKRALRSGHAYAEGAWLHGKSPERHCVKECRSTWFWGLIIPSLGLGLALPSYGLSLLVLSGYPLLVYRIFRYKQKRDYENRDSLLYAWFCVLGKFPQLQGQIQFYIGRLLRRNSKLIEYKKFTAR